jgi:hypothetical protein
MARSRLRAGRTPPLIAAALGRSSLGQLIEAPQARDRDQSISSGANTTVEGGRAGAWRRAAVDPDPGRPAPAGTIRTSNLLGLDCASPQRAGLPQATISAWRWKWLRQQRRGLGGWLPAAFGPQIGGDRAERGDQFA